MLCIHKCLTITLLVNWIQASLLNVKGQVSAVSIVHEPARSRAPVVFGHDGTLIKQTPSTMKEAIEWCHAEKIRQYRAEGQRPSFENVERAIYRANAELLNTVLEGLDLSQPEFCSPTPKKSLLSCSCQMDRALDPEDMTITRIIVKHGARPNDHDIYSLVCLINQTALELLLPLYTGDLLECASSMACSPDIPPCILAVLLRSGMKAEWEVLGDHAQPLWQTTRHRDYAKVKLLLEAGANPNRGLLYPDHPIGKALEFPDCIDLVFLMLKYDVAVPERVLKTLPKNKLLWLKLFNYVGRFQCLYQLAMDHGLPNDVLKEIGSRFIYLCALSDRGVVI